ncbi:MAG: Uncharacterised protein [Bacteroidetes bacterium MED-G17]|nr:MAG: Uncharacterised protein [Bacteroidetes bacterium MED-G17]
MYEVLKNLHSFLRWGVLLFGVLAILLALYAWIRKSEYKKHHNQLSLLFLIFTHTQILIGLILYFLSPVVKIAMQDFGAAMKNESLRFWSLEHPVSMILGAVLISVGRSISKKTSNPVLKHRRTFLYFLAGILVIISAIPNW